MRKALSTILQYVIFLGLGVGIIYHMLHELTETQKNELLDAIKSVNFWYFIPIIVIAFMSHLFRAIRWKYLLETIELRPTTTNTIFAVLIGYITNLALPRAGEVAKCTVLAKYEKLPAHKMVGTIVAERAFDMLCLVVIAVFALVIQINYISTYVGDKVHNFVHQMETKGKVIVIAFIVLLLVIGIIAWLYKSNSDSKFAKILKELNNGILSIFHMQKKWQFLGYTFLIWLMYLLQVYVGFLALPATAHLSVSVALVVLVYGSVGLIITPGGIGTYTFLVAQILEVYNLADVQAQAFGWIAWSVQTFVTIVLGVFALLLIHTYNKRRDAQIAVDRK